MNENSRDLADLDPELRPLCEAFLAKCREAGLKVILCQTYRSTAYQNSLYAKGRTAPGLRVTNAKGGSSPHNWTKAGKPWARAFDIAIQRPDGKLESDAGAKEWATAGAIGLQLGLDWGGAWASFKDAPHFQLPNWRTRP